ncbi:MAG: right-handed parallel beta-helix repeat-containing protein [Planctomycetes bacterium]|nr:right-handed parallel beta-helix repeat-containing protein [Planctomycetota bacterium]
MFGLASAPPAVDTTVKNSAELRAALAGAGPGARIQIESGDYTGGLTRAALRGSADQPIVLRGADPARPPRIRGGIVGLHLSGAEHVVLEDLHFEGQGGNGLNLDDGGSSETPARALVLRRITVREVGPRGNCDGIKLSGVNGFRIEDCTLERWGSGGSGIDLVGCRDGRIEGCTLRNPPQHASASGVQIKGGSRDVQVLRCRFENAGERALNLGGSTGPSYFRPPLEDWPEERYEAAELRVEGCTIVGSSAPLACVGADGVVMRFNTLYRPERWALRILQETREPGFVACRNGLFAENLVVFERAHWHAGGINVGTGTEPASFRFERNAWTCADAPERTAELVRTPSPETAGRHGIAPGFADEAALDLRVAPGSALADVGAHAWKPAPDTRR